MDTGVLATVVAIAALLALIWFRRAHRRAQETPEERYRRDVAALTPRKRPLPSSVSTDELWSAGSAAQPSRAKKAGATFMAGLIGSGCGGCGGCGCGG